MLITNLSRSTPCRLNLALDLLIDYMLENHEEIAVRHSKLSQGLGNKAISLGKQQPGNIHVIS